MKIALESDTRQCLQGLEVGFGSPTIYDQVTDEELVGDAGFGAPEYIIAHDNFTEYCIDAETGFGDPWDGISMVLQGDVKLSDHGGDLLALRGRFDLLFDTFDIPAPQFEKPVGPFFAKFISQTINGLEYDAFSALPGLKKQLYTNISQDEIQLGTEPMLQGPYTLRIFYGQGRITYLDFPESIEVVHRLRNDKTLSIKNNMPKRLKVGLRSDHDVLGTQYYKKDESTFSKIIHGIGQNFNHMYNHDYTLTTQQHPTNVSILHVETTLDFPDKGTLLINDGQILEYTGRTNTTFTGITGMTDIIDRRVRVSKPNPELNDIDNYYKIQNNGFFKPISSITESEWLKSFNIVEFNERHSEQVIFLYFYNLLKQLNLVKQVNISGDRISAPLDSSSWNCQHIQRICRIGERFHFIMCEDPDDETGLQLDNIGCSYWNGSHNEAQGRPDGYENGEYTIEILPWNIEQDHMGRFTISLEKTVFNSFQGYIDRDYIDRNIFIDGIDLDNSTQRNLNLDIFVAGGIIDKLELKKQCDEFFGTYFRSDVRPEVFQILPATKFEL